MSYYQSEGSAESSPIWSGDHEEEFESENVKWSDSEDSDGSDDSESEPKNLQKGNKSSKVLANNWVDLDRSRLHDRDHWRKVLMNSYKVPEKLETPAKSNFVNSYFMPYLGEPDPTYYMIFNKKNNAKFAKERTISPFKPTYGPEDHFIQFALEVAAYINEFQDTGGISRAQYAALLNPHFPIEIWDSMRYRKPNEMLLAYATTCYHWGQRRHDFKGYEELPISFRCGEKRTHQRDLIEALSMVPGGELTLFIYEGPLGAVDEIFRKKPHLFNPAGFPTHLENVDVGEIVREATTALSRSITARPLSFVSLYKKRDLVNETNERTHKRKRAETPLRRSVKREPELPPSLLSASHSAGEWYKGEPKTECIKLWNNIPDVPSRTFQSFVYPSSWTLGDPKETKEEMEFRARYKLCKYCGNHLYSDRTNGHQSHPFYEMFRAKRQSAMEVASVSAGVRVERLPSQRKVR